MHVNGAHRYTSVQQILRAEKGFGLYWLESQRIYRGALMQ
jgi:hypothetical protein